MTRYVWVSLQFYFTLSSAKWSYEGQIYRNCTLKYRKAVPQIKQSAEYAWASENCRKGWYLVCNKGGFTEIDIRINTDSCYPSHWAR